MVYFCFQRLQYIYSTLDVVAVTVAACMLCCWYELFANVCDFSCCCYRVRIGRCATQSKSRRLRSKHQCFIAVFHLFECVKKASTKEICFVLRIGVHCFERQRCYRCRCRQHRRKSVCISFGLGVVAHAFNAFSLSIEI